MPIGYKRCVYVAYLQSDQPNPKPLLNEIAKLKELSNICNFQRLIKQFFKFGAVWVTVINTHNLTFNNAAMQEHDALVLFKSF